ncbi:MAG: DUF2178 domain-containing protein [Methanoregulaceae archaeon]|jgi:uncharacterized membrane protein|nr:DUF2178 domain-containing protein [Methanoregulaceae archaeon]
MKQNFFYILAGIAGLVEVCLFYLSVEFSNPMLITIGFIAGVLLLYIAYRRISDRQVDERLALINQKAGMATFMVFWVIFFATSLGSAVIGLGAPRFPHHLPSGKGEPGLPDRSMNIPDSVLGSGGHIPDNGSIRLGYFGYMQLAFLFLMFFLYVGFRVYYARKYGEWETDEEQD